MIVTIKGRVIEFVDGEKEGRKYTDVFLHQKGQRELIKCRIPRQKVDEGAEITITGNLMIWQAGNAIGYMVYCLE